MAPSPHEGLQGRPICLAGIYPEPRHHVRKAYSTPRFGLILQDS